MRHRRIFEIVHQFEIVHRKHWARHEFVRKIYAQAGHTGRAYASGPRGPGSKLAWAIWVYH